LEENIIGNRIKKLRNKRDLKQEKVAKDLSITVYQLSRYENGISKLTPELIAQFAKYYNVTGDYLLGLSDDPRLTADQQIEVNKEFKKLKEMISELPDGPEKSKVIQRILDYTAGLVDGSKDHKLHE